MTIDRKNTQISAVTDFYESREGRNVLSKVRNFVKVHVITLCQLNELRIRMLIIRRFQMSKTTYFLAKKLPSLVF